MTVLRWVVYAWITITVVSLGVLSLLAFAGWIAEAARTHRARVLRHNEILRRVQARRAALPHGAAHRAPRAVPAHGRTAQARHPRRPAPTPPSAA